MRWEKNNFLITGLFDICFNFGGFQMLGPICEWLKTHLFEKFRISRLIVINFYLSILNGFSPFWKNKCSNLVELVPFGTKNSQ